MSHSACIEAMNDLIKINNDRIEGYEKAIDELHDGKNSDLKSLFSQMISESRTYKSEGSPDGGTTTSGIVYRAWMDVRAAFSGGDRASVLSNCEAGEDAAQKAYKSAIEDEDVMEETKILLREQKQSLRNSHDKIKALRDSAKA